MMLTDYPLVVQYCKTAPTDSNFQARFKLIPHLNMQELGCPSYISKYNGKPGEQNDE
jgi:hypothetical protein